MIVDPHIKDPPTCPHGRTGLCLECHAAGMGVVRADNPLKIAPASPLSEIHRMDVSGYELLASVLHRAYDQAARGKGKDRHASDNVPFEQQPMSTINDLLGSGDGFLYQAIKKMVESRRLPPGRDVAELLGAINYIAGYVLQLERSRESVNQ